MTIADATSSIQTIEQRIASISPLAAQIFAPSAATTSSSTTTAPTSFASQLQAAGVDPTSALDDPAAAATTDPATASTLTTASAPMTTMSVTPARPARRPMPRRSTTA